MELDISSLGLLVEYRRSMKLESLMDLILKKNKEIKINLLYDYNFKLLFW
ncbi:hypothetical protein LCGC14_0416290 [marine sediment metagenome]|uniref:Uncharacterized protein n=1 Tax=marine sediment metagenome TaxID=412755 RepID=A0A0F9SSE2_9ZZZZ|nr:MAG: hypothetical protein Lokiarch_47700 [Candidatus Lokiarchaeum sp. GC14_75]